MTYEAGIDTTTNTIMNTIESRPIWSSDTR